MGVMPWVSRFAFVHHIEAEPVAQAIEVGVIGIVGAAHRVEVVPLHQQQILLHVGRVTT
jgi:hypothetical protein